MRFVGGGRIEVFLSKVAVAISLENPISAGVLHAYEELTCRLQHLR
jgi:hypothetical protein